MADRPDPRDAIHVAKLAAQRVTGVSRVGDNAAGADDIGDLDDHALLRIGRMDVEVPGHATSLGLSLAAADPSHCWGPAGQVPCGSGYPRGSGSSGRGVWVIPLISTLKPQMSRSEPTPDISSPPSAAICGKVSAGASRRAAASAASPSPAPAPRWRGPLPAAVGGA